MTNTTNNITLIIGLGKTGLSVARYLENSGQPFVVVDTRSPVPSKETVLEMSQCVAVLETGLAEIDTALMTQLKQAVISPGVACEGELIEQLRNSGVGIIGDIEIFALNNERPVIAITGSNGKSTVTSLTAELLKSQGIKVGMGGNIGTPALELLDVDFDIIVLELSSFQLETLSSLKPVAATVLNITEDHMDRYASFDDYAAAKLKLLPMADHTILTDEMRDAFVLKSSRSLSLKSAADYRREACGESFTLVSGNRLLADVKDLKIIGSHNHQNALTAIALCELSGYEFNEAMHKALCAYAGLAHRCEYVGTIDGIQCFNDSKATNVGATQAALEGLEETHAGHLLLIAGGEGKGADFSALKALFERTLKALYLIGKDAELILKQAGQGINAVICDTLDMAFELALKDARSGDAILLSPACASLDMYSNFEARGEHFRRLVEAHQ